MCLTQRMHFLLEVFLITAIALASVINHYHINGYIRYCSLQSNFKIIEKLDIHLKQ